MFCRLLIIVSVAALICGCDGGGGSTTYSIGGSGGGGGGGGTPPSGFGFTLVNTTLQTIYVYNFPYLSPEKTQPITLAASQSVLLPLVRDKSMRIYFANEQLKNTIEQGLAPDIFNYSMDATVSYTFAEYLYEPANSRYTVDLSYIDEYSYPLTIKFSDVPSSYTGCEPGFTYGFTSLATVKDNLKKQTDFRWDALIWPATVVTTWDNGKYPQNMDRIIGPNKVWPALGGNWVPRSYDDFFASLPKDGMQLNFKLNNVNTTNWLGWQWNTAVDNPGPSFTGYVKALQQAAIPDKNGKYGFFTYPQDNTSGEFTYVPDSATCTITIYPYDK